MHIQTTEAAVINAMFWMSLIGTTAFWPNSSWGQYKHTVNLLLWGLIITSLLIILCWPVSDTCQFGPGLCAPVAH